MMDLIYTLLLWLVHWVARFVLKMKSAFFRYSMKYRYRHVRFSAEPPHTIAMNDKGLQLKKMPKHMSFLLLDKHSQGFSITHVANVIFWCLSAGVPYVSIYDPEDVIKSQWMFLIEEIKEREDKLGKKGVKVVVRFPQLDSSTYKAQGKNGYKSLLQIEVRLYSKADGQRDIVHAARHACEHLKELRSSGLKINQETISSFLKASQGIPDPDLALLCGDIKSLLGFLPWQSRLTEFVSVPALPYLEYIDFLGALEKYNSCEQRFGK